MSEATVSDYRKNPNSSRASASATWAIDIETFGIVDHALAHDGPHFCKRFRSTWPYCGPNWLWVHSNQVDRKNLSEWQLGVTTRCHYFWVQSVKQNQPLEQCELLSRVAASVLAQRVSDGSRGKHDADAVAWLPVRKRAGKKSLGM